VALPLALKGASILTLLRSQSYYMSMWSIILEGEAVSTPVQKVGTHGVGHWKNSVEVTDTRDASFSLETAPFSPCYISLEIFFYIDL
jgi:hypothetical protein